MPPGHHSSSHHSSSHHSSSHHSSSHHSSSHHYGSSHSGSSRSSSYLWSFNVGPSRHSNTTHSYNRGPSGSLSRSSTPTYRVRNNQPKGYRSGLSGYKPITTLICKKHDYVYYPISWQDEATGQSYQKGYYDEDGKHYDNIALKTNGVYTTTYQCEYCDTPIKLEWTEGAFPNCPNCGAVIHSENIISDEVTTAAPVTENSYNPSYSYNNASDLGNVLQKFKFIPIFFAICFGLSIFSSVISSLRGGGLGTTTTSSYSGSDSGYAVTGYTNNESTFGDSYYVEAIGRYCDWYEEYESYYDPDTDCYFYFNGDERTGQWQYWYEGISSDYPESGWMEYDFDDEKWYIETEYGEWKLLPQKYQKDYLWHIE